MQFASRFLLAVALGALAAGCGLTLDYDPPTDGGVDTGSGCGAGCPSDRACVAGACRLRCTGTACSDDPAVCESCVDGVCLPADVTCGGTSTCALAQCEPVMDLCTLSSTCETGYACVDGECVPGSCAGDADCTALIDACDEPFVCQAGTCAPIDRGICPALAFSCAVVDPCTCGPTMELDPALCGELHCDPETANCVECLETSHCETGEVCEATRHVCVECATNLDCASGLLCDPSTFTCVQCVDGVGCPDSGASVCDPTSHTCVECLGDGDCGAVGTTGAYCEDGRCVACRSNADCDRSLPVCGADGSCGPCSTDADCGPGSRCNLEGACVLRDCSRDDECPGLGCASGRCDGGACSLLLDDAACGAGGEFDDLVGCTVDTCEPSAATRDGCVHRPNDGLCVDDGYSCTLERCAPRAVPGVEIDGCAHLRDDSACSAATGTLPCALSVCAGGEVGANVDPATGCGLTYEPARCGGRVCAVSGYCDEAPRCGPIVGECPDDGNPCNGRLTCLLGTCNDTLDLGLDRCLGRALCTTYCASDGCAVRADPPPMLMCAAIVTDGTTP